MPLLRFSTNLLGPKNNYGGYMRKIMIAAAIGFGLSAFGAMAQGAAGTATGQDQQNASAPLNDTSTAPNHDNAADAKHKYGSRQNGPNSAADDRRDDKGAPGSVSGPSASKGKKDAKPSPKTGEINPPKDQ
jgi:hypothetical protein